MNLTLAQPTQIDSMKLCDRIKLTLSLIGEIAPDLSDDQREQIRQTLAEQFNAAVKEEREAGAQIVHTARENWLDGHLSGRESFAEAQRQILARGRLALS